MTTDAFNDAAISAYEDYVRQPRMNVGTMRDRIAEAHMDGWHAARDHLAAQEPTDAAQIIDQHRENERWVGNGVKIECVCGHSSHATYDFSGPITAEKNNHRDAERMHALHVANALSAARNARTEEES